MLDTLIEIDWFYNSSDVVQYFTGWKRDFEGVTEKDIKEQVDAFSPESEEMKTPGDLTGKDSLDDDSDSIEDSFNEAVRGESDDSEGEKQKQKKKKRVLGQKGRSYLAAKKRKGTSRRVMKLKQKSQIGSGVTRRLIRTAPSQ